MYDCALPSEYRQDWVVSDRVRQEQRQIMEDLKKSDDYQDLQTKIDAFVNADTTDERFLDLGEIGVKCLAFAEFKEMFPYSDKLYGNFNLCLTHATLQNNWKSTLHLVRGSINICDSQYQSAYYCW